MARPEAAGSDDRWIELATAICAGTGREVFAGAQSTWGESLAGDADRGIPRCVQRTGATAELGSDVWRQCRERTGVGRRGTGKATGRCGSAERQQFWDLRLCLRDAAGPTRHDLATHQSSGGEDLGWRV